MTAIHVDHFTYALGSVRRSVEETAASGETLSGAQALRSAGFRQHWICAPGQSALDLATAAVERLSPNLTALGAVIYATCIPANGNCGEFERSRTSRDVKHLMDFPVSHLQTRFELKDAYLIGLNQQACTGMLGAMRLAKAMLRAEPELGRILCVTADRFPEGSLYEQSFNLISDGAAACILSAHPAAFEILACHGVTNGALASATDDEVVGQFFRYTYDAVLAVLRKAGLGIGQVDWIVPQNINPKAWHILAHLLGLDQSKIAMPSLGEAGHAISADIAINLSMLQESGNIAPNQHLLLVMMGYGLNWQCILLRKRGKR